MLCLILYGYSKDKAEIAMEKTISGKTRVIDIGLKDKIKKNKEKVKKMSHTKIAIPERRSRTTLKKKTLQDNESGNYTASEFSIVSKQDKKRVIKPSQSSVDTLSECPNSSPTSEQAKLLKKNTSFFIKFVHALKTAHNFFSIFLRKSTDISRPHRFLLYFMRWYGIIAITSTFFRVISSDTYSPV